MTDRTPEQEERAQAEVDPHHSYPDGWPKYHRHFASFDIHTDKDCANGATRRRVYVFDEEYMDAHEAHIRADERAKAYDDIIAILNATRR